MRLDEQAWTVAVRVTRALEEEGLEYAIGGALSFGAWGQPRGTLDVDLTVYAAPDELERIWRTLEKAGAHVERDLCRRQVLDASYFDVSVGDLRVDVFLPDMPLYDWAYRRRREFVVRGAHLWMLSAEDTLLFKMLFFRDKDKGDIRTLVAVQMQNLDLAYVRKALRELIDDAERSRWFEDLVREIIGPVGRDG